MGCEWFERTTNRRDLLRTSAAGFGSVALAGLAAQQAFAEQTDAGPLTARVPHFAARAKRVIFLFMWGGPSHVDLFDPKPKLNDGQINGRKLLPSPFRFRQHGDSGTEISELMPHLAQHADKLCVVRSMHTNGPAHGEALLWLHTGQANLVRPSVGAWVSYGLGTESETLPGYVTISPPRGHGGVQNYGSAFLPAVHQGTAIGSAELPIKDARVVNLRNDRRSSGLQQKQLELIQSFNRRHLKASQVDPRIEGLISSYELAFRMQSTMPQVLDLANETRATLDSYGIGSEPTDNFGRQCLLARRFAESGVRYIQVSTNYTWDHHKDVVKGLKKESAQVDLPIAGLLKDLDQRGLLEDTLILWGGEFGRTPTPENGNGRGHHPAAFTMWMAGGGVENGLTYGTTDEIGSKPVENPVHMHDLHATLLHCLGLEHERLTYRHAGREFRLTDVYGNVVHDILA